MHVFMSQSDQDKLIAREIAAKLRSANLSVFLDEGALSPGQEYDSERASVCRGDIRSTSFVFREILAPIGQLQKCEMACPPANLCQVNQRRP